MSRARVLRARAAGAGKPRGTSAALPAAGTRTPPACRLSAPPRAPPTPRAARHRRPGRGRRVRRSSRAGRRWRARAPRSRSPEPVSPPPRRAGGVAVEPCDAARLTRELLVGRVARVALEQLDGDRGRDHADDHDSEQEQGRQAEAQRAGHRPKGYAARQITASPRRAGDEPRARHAATPLRRRCRRAIGGDLVADPPHRDDRRRVAELAPDLPDVDVDSAVSPANVYPHTRSSSWSRVRTIPR